MIIRGLVVIVILIFVSVCVCPYKVSWSISWHVLVMLLNLRTIQSMLRYLPFSDWLK